MRTLLLALLVLSTLGTPAVSHAFALGTAPADNGGGGIFTNLQPVDQALTITAFDLPFNTNASGVPVTVEVWTRSGSYAGFTDSAAGWTLSQTLAGVTQGSDEPVPLALTTPISLSPGQITAVYLQAIGSPGIEYTGTAAVLPQTDWANDDLALFSDTGVTGVSAFGGTQFSPRTFSGSIRYSRSLQTAPPNNDSGGVFLDLQPVDDVLAVTGFDVALNASPGVATSIEVWTRSGSYVGFTDSSEGWTLTQTVGGASQGLVTLAPFVLSTPIALSPTRVTAVYLHAVVPGAGIRYTGFADAPPQTNWSNADLVLFSDTSRAGAVPFEGNLNSPRTFAGTLHYSQSPSHTVTPTADVGGTISPDSPQATIPGESQIFALSADADFAIGSVGGSCGGNLVGSTYTTDPVTADCTVIASFTRNTTTVLGAVPGPVPLVLGTEFTATVSGVTVAPADGEVEISANTGESCIDTGPPQIEGTEASFGCMIVFTTPGPRLLTASYSGSQVNGDSSSAPQALDVFRVANLIVMLEAAVGEVAPGEPVAYVITAYNAGPNDAPASGINVVADPSLIDAEWVCTAYTGAVCAAPSGIGDIATVVDLPGGGGLQFFLTGEIPELPDGSLLMEAEVSADAAAPHYVVDPALGNNIGSSTFQLSRIFNDDFE